MKKVYDNGYYIGELKNGKRHGKGTYYWNAGDKYEGEWKNGKRNGYGIMTFADGSIKEGQWVDSEFIG